MNVYKTKGTCSTQILFDVTDDGKVTGVKFIGGCRGNLQAVARLSEGKTPEELKIYVENQLKEREPFYSQAMFRQEVSPLCTREKIDNICNEIIEKIKTTDK